MPIQFIWKGKAHKVRVVPTKNRVSADSNTLTSESDRTDGGSAFRFAPLSLYLSLSRSPSLSPSVRVCKRAKSHFIEHLRH